MKYANLVLFGLGVALLIAVLGEVDIASLVDQIKHVGIIGFFAITLVYAVGFAADVLSWQMVTRPAAANAVWFGRLFIIRALGEVYNNVTPAASMAGEPVKIWLLKHNHDVSYTDSTRSLVLTKTASMTALTAFVGAGLVTALLVQDLTRELKIISATAFLVLLAMITVFVLLQRAGALGASAERLSRLRYGRWLAPLVKDLHRFDRGVWQFYICEKRLFGWSFVFAMAGWLFGVVEIFAIFALLSHPLSWTEALIIEAALQLMRTLAFLVPAGLGVQEVTLFVVAGAFTGVPQVGVAAAVLRRCRELAWIGFSLCLGFRYSLSGMNTRLAE